MGQFFGQFKGCLATELHDHPFRFLVFDDFPNMFPEDRFEIQLIGHVEIGGYRLGVAVDHDGLKPAFFDGQQSVYAAVVEFYALSDAVWTAAQHDDFFLVADLAFADATVFKSAVKIWGFCFKFRGAGIDHLENPSDSGGFAFFVQFVFLSVLHDLADLVVAEAHLFGLADDLFGKGIHFILGDFFFQGHDLLDLIDEPAIDLCGLHDTLHADAHHQCILDAEDPIPFRYLEIVDDLL